MSDATKALIDDLLLERISSVRTAKVANQSFKALITVACEKYTQVLQQVKVRQKRALTVKYDEASSFVADRYNIVDYQS